MANRWFRPPENQEEWDHMSYKIVADQCTGCGACEYECPNKAISESGGVFVIDAGKCTECKGFFDSAQCAAVCPVDGTCIPA